MFLKYSKCVSWVFALVTVLFVVVSSPANAEWATEGGVVNGGDEAQVGEYFINIGTVAEEILVRRARAIQNGATVEFVEKTLGKPDVDKTLVDKRGVFVARRFNYYSRKVAKGVVSETKDRYVSFDFDAIGRLSAKREKLGAH